MALAGTGDGQTKTKSEYDDFETEKRPRAQNTKIIEIKQNLIVSNPCFVFMFMLSCDCFVEPSFRVIVSHRA